MKQTIWTKYAKKYNVSIVQAIADRDEPMNAQECINAYFESTGHNPCAREVSDMLPDSEETIKKQIDYYRE